MHIGGAQWLFPVRGCIPAHVTKFVRTCCHALPELRCERVQAVLGHAEGLKAREAERGAERGLGEGIEDLGG